MNRLRYAIAVVILVSPIICGCGSNNKSGSATEQSQQLISSLRSDLDGARKELEAQTDLNRSLDDQIQSLTSKLDEIERQSSSVVSKPDQSASGSSGSFDSQSRVALMGAKALAEFKAEQLNAKLEKLTKELRAKEGELGTAVSQTQTLSAEVTRLKEAVRETAEKYDNLYAQKNTQVDQMSAELKKLSGQVNDLKHDVAEKEELLITLKKAYSDAAQLKSASETEVNRLKNELSNMSSQLASFKDAAERGAQETTVLKKEIQLAQERLDSATTQLEKLTNEALLSDREIERLKTHSANLANKLYAMERAAGVDSENFVTSVDRIISGNFGGTPQGTATR